MKRINLIPEEARHVNSIEWLRREFVRNKMFQLAFGIILFIIALTIWEFTAVIRYGIMYNEAKLEYNNRNNELQNAKRDYESTLDETKKKKKERELLRKRLETLESVLKERVDWSRALLELPKIIPEKLWFKKIKLEKDVLTLQGEATDNDTIASFMKDLDKSGVFSDTSFGYTKKEEKKKEKKGEKGEEKKPEEKKLEKKQTEDKQLIAFEVVTHFKVGIANGTNQQ